MRSHRRHKYEYRVDITDDSAAARVVRMVGERKRVLEVGAGPGSITRMLRDCGDCRVTALEIDSDAIDSLKPICEQVYQTDLNNPAWSDSLQTQGPFEVIVAADVLEHLYDPWSTLAAMKALVKPEGYLVISLPHVGHSAVVACLLNGDFDYRDTGLLDRTHIRFFGIKNVQTLFEKSGLKITEAQFVMRRPEDTEFAEQWLRVPAETRIALSSKPFGAVYQVVVKAVPAESPGKAISLPSLSLGEEPIPPRFSGAGPWAFRKRLKALTFRLLGPKTRSRLNLLASRMGIRL